MRRSRMRTRSMVGRALVTLGVTLGLLGAAGAPGGAQDAGTVRIAVNAWTGYEADYAVVANLLESQLGYTVERSTSTNTSRGRDSRPARSTRSWRSGATTRSARRTSTRRAWRRTPA
jgi:hypothetical protein